MKWVLGEQLMGLPASLCEAVELKLFMLDRW